MFRLVLSISVLLTWASSYFVGIEMNLWGWICQSDSGALYFDHFSRYPIASFTTFSPCVELWEVEEGFAPIRWLPVRVLGHAFIIQWWAVAIAVGHAVCLTRRPRADRQRGFPEDLR